MGLALNFQTLRFAKSASRFVRFKCLTLACSCGAVRLFLFCVFALGLKSNLLSIQTPVSSPGTLLSDASLFQSSAPNLAEFRHAMSKALKSLSHTAAQDCRSSFDTHLIPVGSLLVRGVIVSMK